MRHASNWFISYGFNVLQCQGKLRGLVIIANLISCFFPLRKTEMRLRFLALTFEPAAYLMQE
jgi:hypothetical protein